MLQSSSHHSSHKSTKLPLLINLIFLVTSGASNLLCRSMEGLTDVRDIDEPIKIGNGDTMRATKLGT
jgi:hypothetical protein